MEVASSVVTHISDKKSELSISLETIDIEPHVVENTSLPFTRLSWFLPRFCSVCFITLLVYWIVTQQNGFINTTPSVITPSTNVTANGYLGYHALGLSLWAVVANQETIMAYAIPLCCTTSYNVRKWTHIIFQLIGMLCGVGGMVSIMWYKNSSVSMPISGTYFTVMDNPYYIPYSPHAWLGLLFMVTWLVQCIGRFFPTYLTTERHRFLGRFMYVAGLACCALGLQQQQTRQIMVNVQLLAQNNTSATAQSNWFLSQPSLGVLLLGLIGGTTFFYGLL
jgi:hypothetical protein